MGATMLRQRETITDAQIDAAFEDDRNFTELVDAANILYIVTDVTGYFLKVSKFWEVVTGFTVKELKSKPWTAFIHPLDIDKSLSLFASGPLFDKNAKAVKGFKNRYKVKGDGWVTLEWSYTEEVKNGLCMAFAIPKGVEP